MDPDDNQNNSNKRSNRNAQELKRRMRAFRGPRQEQQQIVQRSSRSNSRSSNNSNHNNMNMPRPEEAPSSMGGNGIHNNNNIHGRRHRSSAAVAAAPADPPAGNEEAGWGDDDDDDDDDDLPLDLGRRLRKRLARKSSNDNSKRRNNTNNNNDVDDEVRRHMAVAAGAAAAANDNIDNNSDDDDDDDGNGGNNHPPLLNDFLRHLQEFCRDGDDNQAGHNNSNIGGPPSSAINVEKARNVLEACAGNVALAGQLYWDDYFASQMHQLPPPPPLPGHGHNHNHNNIFPPLDAPSAAAAAPPFDPAEEERRVRRRLESDFERLLPHPAAADAAAETRHGRNNRRRRRRRLDPAADVADAGGVLVNVERNNNINNNNRNRQQPGAPRGGDADEQPPAAAAIPRQPQDNQALFVAARAVLGAAGDDAAEGSASVSDDEAGVAGVLRMVRERGHILRTRGRRRRHSASFDNNLEYVRARDMINAQFAQETAADESAEPTNKNLEKRKRKMAKRRRGGGDDDYYDHSSSSESGDDSCNDSDDDSDDAYLSENDWLLSAHHRAPASSGASANSTNSQSTQQLRAPIDVLWRGHPDVPAPGKEASDKKKNKGDDDKEMKDGTKIKKEEDDGVDGGEDDDIDDGGNDGNADAETAASKRPEIPTTWLHASFSPHATAVGLALKDPKPEDVAENSLQMQQHNPADASPSGNNRRDNSLPLPYHCRSVTAVLSIVTAMIYTGASVQSNQVTCSSSRVPYLELSEEERTREFEGRLIDALSSLILIAARASMERKQKAVTKILAKKKRRKKRKQEISEVDQDEEPDTLQQCVQRRIKLCPVAWWKDNSSGEPTQPADQWHEGTNSPWIQVATSYTNIADVRAFVLSNMRSFTHPGGVALLLETIVGIHGEGAVTRMLRRARAAAEKATMDNKDGNIPVPPPEDCGSTTNPFLVCCKCEERQRKRLQDPTLTAAEKRKLLNSLDTTPPFIDCVGVELISLLLTGKIHSTWKGWSTGPLGFGILSYNAGEIGHALSRPEMPVWVLKGDTCYSVLLLDHTNHGDNLDERSGIPKAPAKGTNANKEKTSENKMLSPSKPKAAPCLKMSQCSNTSRSRDLHEAQQFAQNDQPGFIANMMHWNCWFGVRNQSGLRLITDRPKWNPPSPSKVLANYREVPHAKHSSSLSCQRKTVVQQLQERRNSLANVVSADEREAADSENAAANARRYEAAMKKIRFHPDDSKFYPKQHRMWRFDMGEDEDAAQDPNAKPRGFKWTTYYSLSPEEQMIVEAKFGPQINRILWNRWPRATIDKFTPEGKSEPPPIV